MALIPMGVAFPANTNDVSEIVKVCSQENIEIIPKGSVLWETSVPSQGKSIIVSFEKMNKIIVGCGQLFNGRRGWYNFS